MKEKIYALIFYRTKPFFCKPMGKKIWITSFFVTMFVTVMMMNSFASNIQVALAKTKDFTKFNNITALVKAIDDGEFDNNHINFAKFTNTTLFKTSDLSMQQCIRKAESLGDNLADYEILECKEKKH
jgi:5-methylthioribose kinase